MDSTVSDAVRKKLRMKAEHLRSDCGACKRSFRARQPQVHAHQRIELFVLPILCTVVKNHALAEGHEPFEKEADKDRLGTVHDRLVFNEKHSPGRSSCRPVRWCGWRRGRLRPCWYRREVFRAGCSATSPCEMPVLRLRLACYWIRCASAS